MEQPQHLHLSSYILQKFYQPKQFQELYTLPNNQRPHLFLYNVVPNITILQIQILHGAPCPLDPMWMMSSEAKCCSSLCCPTEIETIGGQLDKPATHNYSVLEKTLTLSVIYISLFPTGARICGLRQTWHFVPLKRSVVFLDSVQKLAAKQSLPEICGSVKTSRTLVVPWKLPCWCQEPQFLWAMFIPPRIQMQVV